MSDKNMDSTMAMLPSVCDTSGIHFSGSESTNHMVPPSHMGDEPANHDGVSASTPEVQSEKNPLGAKTAETNQQTGEKNPLGAKTAETNQKILQTSVSKSDANKTNSFPKSVKTRDAGGHAVADDDIARWVEADTPS